MPLLEMPFESCPCRLMRRHEAALAKFGASNHQTIWRDVVNSQLDSFGLAVPCMPAKRTTCCRLTICGAMIRTSGLKVVPKMA